MKDNKRKRKKEREKEEGIRSQCGSLAAPSFTSGEEEKWSSSSLEDLSACASASNEIHSTNCNNSTCHTHFCRRILQCGCVSQRILNYHVTGESNLIGTQL